MKKWITALTFALALLVLSACSAQPGKTAAETEAKKADTEKLLVGFSNWSRSFEFYVDIETGMKEKADELGIDIPGRLSLIGFDNISATALSRIDLTTIVQPKKAMAVQAVDMLRDKIEHGTQGYVHQILLPTLIRRGTCKEPFSR